MIKFYARIEDNDPRHFSDHSLLLQYIHDRIIPICNSPRAYKFNIWFLLGKHSAASELESLLQLTEIQRCSNVDISFETFSGLVENELPVEAISNWLERFADGMENIRDEKEKLLRIGFYGFRVQNALEMVDHLKTVYFIYSIFVKNICNIEYQGKY